MSTAVALPPPPIRTTKDLKAAHHLSSGGASGLASAITLQPLDLLKTRLQQAYATEAKGAKRRKLSQVVSGVLRDDGIQGLWRGTTPTVVRNVPGVAMYFYSLSAIRGYLTTIPFFAIPLTQPTGQPPTAVAALPASSVPAAAPISPASNTALVKLSPQGNLIAGAIGRTGVGFILNPVTVLKARFESGQYKEYKSLFSAFKSLLRQNGVRGLFQGFTATAARDAPYAGMYLVFYEKGKDLAGRLVKPEWGIPYAAQHSVSGALAAILATTITSPADVVKTRMQVNFTNHPTIRIAISKIYADRGLAGFFSGSSLRVSRKAASSAIAWTVYEGLLLFYRDREA
ncbi:mitochondrial carrier domain-containing protein [Dioszegia hungarica]|uniref:Mitochondrial glycine transporter n=1 Tax=Dioszegia hungarica TaxID=4972 RepID=A0AA38HC11_9TREE|nr:mitochondrial carrier domain-containing protein [Dioszegia hungarica]KAI9637615.1 mitochondrial carrier domain-containing protein [Dioszegia hungarica]